MNKHILIDPFSYRLPVQLEQEHKVTWVLRRIKMSNCASILYIRCTCTGCRLLWATAYLFAYRNIWRTASVIADLIPQVLIPWRIFCGLEMYNNNPENLEDPGFPPPRPSGLPGDFPLHVRSRFVEHRIHFFWDRTDRAESRTGTVHCPVPCSRTWGVWPAV